MNPHSGITDLGFARLDTNRSTRQGLPEVVYAPGKHADEIVRIADGLLGDETGPVLVTRVEPDVADTVLAKMPGGRYHQPGRLLVWRPAPARDFRMTVVTAGTADGPAAWEAAAVAEAIGLDVRMQLHPEIFQHSLAVIAWWLDQY